MNDEVSAVPVPCAQGGERERTAYQVVGTIDLRAVRKAGEDMPRTLRRLVDVVRTMRHSPKIGITACGRGVYVHRGVTERQPVHIVACRRPKAEGEHYLDVYDTEVLRLLEAATARPVGT